MTDIKQQAVIFDLDDTLFNAEHRRHLANKKKLEEYFAAGENDTVNNDILNELYAQQRAGRAIVLMTGCPERFRTMTESKLANAEINYDFLLMRPDDSFASNSLIKSNWAYSLRDKFDFVAAYDDLQQTVDMFFRYGIPAYLVVNGYAKYKHSSAESAAESERRGKAKKRGKGVGRKPGITFKPKTKPASVRLPPETIELYKIDHAWLQDAVARKLEAITGLNYTPQPTTDDFSPHPRERLYQKLSQALINLLTSPAPGDDDGLIFASPEAERIYKALAQEGLLP